MSLAPITDIGPEIAGGPTIHELMPRVMEEVGAIGKNRTNTQQNFKFRGIDDAMSAVQPALIKLGVHYVPEVLSYESERYTSTGGSNMRNITVLVAYTFFGPLGDSVRCVTLGEAADAGDKAAGKAQSIALKFALLHALCIPVEDMADPDGDSHQRATQAVSGPSGFAPVCARCGITLAGHGTVRIVDGQKVHADCPPVEDPF